MRYSVILFILFAFIYSCSKKESSPALTPPVVFKLTGCDSIKQGFLKSSSDSLRLLSCFSLPVVTTTSITEITNNSAFSGGNVTSNGDAAITVRGVCWSKSEGPTITDNRTIDGVGIGSFTSKLSNLNSNTNYYVRSYATNILGTVYGNQIIFKSSFSFVTIGTQVWMDKNLDVETYQNGEVIPEIKDPAAWAQSTKGAWCYYNNDPANGPIYGKLYNRYAVNDPRGLAPLGWHIPIEKEWVILSKYLGGDSVSGGKMKFIGTTRWVSPNTSATNESGFTALPGGFRFDNDGLFGGVGFEGAWLTTAESGSSLNSIRYLTIYSGSLYGGQFIGGGGYSVRCLKD